MSHSHAIIKHWNTARRTLRRTPAHLGLGVLFLLSRFPLHMQYTFGNMAGGLLFKVLKSRRNTSITNIKLCFPELSEQQQLSLAKKAFNETAIGMLEAAYIWWNSPDQILKNTDFHGLELIDEALTHGQGILLIGAHFPSLEIA
ncbi:MAG: lipid A biosynthesis acyltransferase, partial [Pseudomonadota bacterium]